MTFEFIWMKFIILSKNNLSCLSKRFVFAVNNVTMVVI